MLVLIASASAMVFVSGALVFAILFERRTLAAIQGRLGPNIAGLAGAAQSAADGLKIFIKSVFIFNRAYKTLFFLLPLILLSLNFIKLLFLPLSRIGAIVDFPHDMFLVFMLLGLDVFVFVVSAWLASSSSFPSISVIREVAQVCGFEVVSGFCFLAVVSYAGTLSFGSCVAAQTEVWFIWALMPYAFVFFMAILAEMHRTPADLAEAESELTAGYQSEHGGLLFSIFYLAEYSALIVLSVLYVLLFLGGWLLGASNGSSLSILVIKAFVVSFVVVVVRAAVPRTRIETLVLSVWGLLLPACVGLFSVYLWLAYIFKAIRLSDYDSLSRGWSAVTTRRGVLLTRSLWSVRATTADIRVDSSLGNFLNAELTSPAIGLKETNFSSAYSGPLLRKTRLGYDSQLQDALLHGGCGMVNARRGSAFGGKYRTVNDNLWGLGALDVSLRSLFDRSGFRVGSYKISPGRFMMAFNSWIYQKLADKKKYNSDWSYVTQSFYGGSRGVADAAESLGLTKVISGSDGTKMIWQGDPMLKKAVFHLSSNPALRSMYDNTYTHPQTGADYLRPYNVNLADHDIHPATLENLSSRIVDPNRVWPTEGDIFPPNCVWLDGWSGLYDYRGVYYALLSRNEFGDTSSSKGWVRVDLLPRNASGYVDMNAKESGEYIEKYKIPMFDDTFSYNRVVLDESEDAPAIEAQKTAGSVSGRSACNTATGVCG